MSESRKWVNQHNYSLVRTTLRCLYSNKLMRLQTGEKQNHPITGIASRGHPRKMSCHLILMADGVFTRPAINMWLPGLTSKELERQVEPFVLRVWWKKKERWGEAMKQNRKRLEQWVAAFVVVIAFCSSRATPIARCRISVTIGKSTMFSKSFTVSCRTLFWQI